MRLSRPWLAGLAVAILAAGAAGSWYYLQRNDAPPPVSLAEALAAASTATPRAAAATPSSSATPATVSGGAETPEATSTADPGAGLVGTWVLDPGASFVGYRVQEQLSGVGATTAVGRTSTLTGRLEFDGAAVTAVEVEADLRTLRSDDSRRDGQLRTQALETGRFPTATFVLTAPIEVGDVAEGEVVRATASGRLTLHGVTREVALDLEGTLSGGAVVIVGSTVIEFADYGIERPRAALVLSVEERAVMELQLTFRRA